MCGAFSIYARGRQWLRHMEPRKIVGKTQTNHFPTPDIAVLSKFKLV